MHVLSMERYGCCRTCLGMGEIKRIECGICGGTGFSGDSMDYIDPSQALRSPRQNKALSVKAISYESLTQIAVSAMVSSQKFGRTNVS